MAAVCGLSPRTGPRKGSSYANQFLAARRTRGAREGEKKQDSKVPGDLRKSIRSPRATRRGEPSRQDRLPKSAHEVTFGGDSGARVCRGDQGTRSGFVGSPRPHRHHHRHLWGRGGGLRGGWVNYSGVVHTFTSTVHPAYPARRGGGATGRSARHPALCCLSSGLTGIHRLVRAIIKHST